MWSRSSVQVRCMRQDAQGWCTGMTLGMGWGGRWKGGSGWGTHVYLLLIHVNVWQKPLQYCKVISLQLKWINWFKKKKNMTNLDSILKSRDITLSTKVRLVKAMVFPVFMYGCESWTVKKAECRWIDAFEKTLESPLDCKEIQPVHPKGDQSWVLIGRTDVESETPDRKSVV